MSEKHKVRLVVFDWAGTTIDHGCLAPVAAFVDVFARHGVEVTIAEARGPMGLHKRDHLRAMLAMPAVAERWRRARGRDGTEDDVQRLYDDSVPVLLEAVDRHARLVPGVRECVEELRRRGIKVGATTGYFREAAERVYEAARRQGYAPDCAVCADDVPAGRPAPWMIFRIMQTLDVYPPSCVVKVGDTVPDLREGRNAGCWSVGVLRSSSEVGLSEEEYDALPSAEQEARHKAAQERFYDAGGFDATLDDLRRLPYFLDRFNERLAARRPPGRGDEPHG